MAAACLSAGCGWALGIDGYVFESPDGGYAFESPEGGTDAAFDHEADTGGDAHADAEKDGCPPGESDCGGTCGPTGMACTSDGEGGCEQTGTVVCSGAGTTCSATPRT